MDAKKKITAGLLITACTLAGAANISNYADLVDSLRAGVAVNMVIDVDKCHYGDNEVDPWKTKTLGVGFDHIYERVGKDIEHGKKMRLVATSEHDYVGRDSVHMMRTVYRIFEDGTTEVIQQEIDPTNFKVVKNTFLFCRLSADASTGVTLTARAAP